MEYGSGTLALSPFFWVPGIPSVGCPEAVLTALSRDERKSHAKGNAMADMWLYIQMLIFNWFNGFSFLTAVPEAFSYIVPGTWFQSANSLLDKHVERDTRRKIYALLALIGLFYASFLAWDKEYQGAISKSPEGVQTQIDELKRTVSDFEARQWPTLKTDTIELLAKHLSRYGEHRVEVHSCSTRDCDLFAGGFQEAFKLAKWPVEPTIALNELQVMWKSPPGIVIVGYGDDAGTTALHDTVKDVLKIDIPTLSHPKRGDGSEVVELKVGTKPLDLRVSQ